MPKGKSESLRASSRTAVTCKSFPLFSFIGLPTADSLGKYFSAIVHEKKCRDQIFVYIKHNLMKKWAGIWDILGRTSSVMQSDVSEIREEANDYHSIEGESEYINNRFINQIIDKKWKNNHRIINL